MRKYTIEFIGTFFLVLVIGLSGNPLAIGSILMVMVYMGGHISGAHYNPAVTLALLMRKKIAANEAIVYMLFQIAGALISALTVYALTKNTFAPAPPALASMLSALVAEILFTFALVSVVLNVAATKSTAGNSYYGLAIGFTVLAGAFSMGPISGGAFNPAVGIGPSLVDTLIGGNNSLANVWLYIVGPFTGAALASVVYGFTNPD